MRAKRPERLLLVALALLAACEPVPGQTRDGSGVIRSGLFVEISGGWGGALEDPGRLNGLFLAGRMGYSIASTATISVRFLSGKQKGEEIKPGTQADLQIGSVGGDLLLRILPASDVTPALIAGYSYSTQTAEGLPVFSGHGVTSGIAVVYHFAKYFALDASAMFSRTWYEPRPSGLAVSPFTEDRIWVEIGIGFYPGIGF